MSDFFDKNFLQGIVVTLLGVILSIWLSSRASPTTTGKNWKIVVILAYILIFVGLYIIGSNVNKGGLNNPFVGLGMFTVIVGWALKHVGKFFIWWN